MVLPQKSSGCFRKIALSSKTTDFPEKMYGFPQERLILPQPMSHFPLRRLKNVRSPSRSVRFASEVCYLPQNCAICLENVVFTSSVSYFPKKLESKMLRFPQESPDFPQKCQVFPQKCQILPQKCLISLRKIPLFSHTPPKMAPSHRRRRERSSSFTISLRKHLFKTFLYPIKYLYFLPFIVL